MCAATTLAEAEIEPFEITKSETWETDTVIYDLHRLNWVSLFRRPPIFLMHFEKDNANPLGDYFKLEDHGRIILTKKLDYETAPNPHILRFKASGIQLRFPGFDFAVHPSEGVGLIDRIQESFHGFSRIPRQDLPIELRINVVDEPVYVDHQDWSLQVKWTDFQSANGASIGAWKVKTRGDDAKGFQIPDSYPNKSAFSIDDQGNLNFRPPAGWDTNLHRVSDSVKQWSDQVSVEVYDGTKWYSGEVAFTLTVTDVPAIPAIDPQNQKRTLQVTYADFEGAITKKSSFSIPEPVRYKGEPKAFNFEVLSRAYQECFTITETGYLKFTPDSSIQLTRDTVPNVATWNDTLTVKVSKDKQTLTEGTVNFCLKVEQMPMVTFEDLVEAAKQVAPPPTLEDILKVSVPEPSERNLMEISTTLKNWKAPQPRK